MMTDGKSIRSPADVRDEFERDYGRVVFSTPVRRLQNKTQVFPMDSHDAVRTRLTHSMEVSSVARGIGAAVGRWLQENNSTPKSIARAIETIAATCGILHDLGNPPFGHAGEDAIRTWFAESASKRGSDNILAKMLKELRGKSSQYADDFTNFEGNAQTIRLLSKLQIFSDFHGLNLTCATLSTASKYLAPSDKIDKKRHDRKKPGYFASENDLIRRVRDQTGTGDARHPITFLVEAADDTVFAFVDLEDGVKKKIMSWNDAKSALREATKDQPETFERALRLAERALEKAPMSPQEKEEALAQGFRTFAIAECAKAAIEMFKLRYDQIMNGDYHEELLFDALSPVRGLLEGAKKCGRMYVYITPGTLKLEILGRNVIHNLMDHFWETENSSSVFGARLQKLISPNYHRVYEHALLENVLPPEYLRFQLITDQITGMTDTFACNLHRELTNG